MVGQDHSINIGGGIGTVAYEKTGGLNIELQYEYQLHSKLSAFVSVGSNRDEFTTEGNSQGTDGIKTWDNSWKFEYAEQFNYVDAGVKFPLLNGGSKYVMKAILGGTLGQSIYGYPDNIVINRGIIEQLDAIDRKIVVGMFLLGIENAIAITDRLSLGLSLNFRTLFQEKHTLNEGILINNGEITFTSGILNVANLVLQVGYDF